MRGRGERRGGLKGETEKNVFQLDAEQYLNQIVNDHYSVQWLALETLGGGGWSLVTGHWSVVGNGNDNYDI